MWLAVWLASLLLLSIRPAALQASPRAQTAEGDSATPAVSTVYLLTFDGAVTPVLESYLNQAIGDAEVTGAEAIILQLDTPGGSVEVTQHIVQSMLASPIPLIVYVSPAGARAGSGGTFVTLAAHIAAMAPNTSIGAASPVESDGSDIDSTLAAKIKNILSADIENLAKRRGEAATEWAIAAVQDAAAATAQQALDLGVIDLIANDIDDLLAQLEGRSVELPTGPVVLHLTGARILEREMSPIQRAINLLVDPSLATILFTLGVIGLIVEFRTPGLNVAGVLGLVCLLLAFYGLGQLDANLTGLAFLALALIFFVAEAFTTSFGLLAVGGIIAFLLGGALAFDAPGLTTPWVTLILLAILLGGLTILVSFLALRAQRRPALTGTEGLIGATGVTKAPFRAGETGSVFVQGEWWNARLTNGEVAANVPVQVLARQGMTLTVMPVQDTSTVDAEPASSGAPSSQTHV
jgi:membrane-bound serine protease (ClpP class)